MTNTATFPHYGGVSDADRSTTTATPASLATFDAAYHEHFGYVWKTLGRLGVPPADLADATHDVFVVAYRRWSELDPTRTLRSWLFGVARRIASDRRRKRREVLGEVPDVPDASISGDRDRLARRDLLWRLLAELSDERLEVVVLHDLEGHTGAAIADQLGLSINTVHSRLRLARADLSAALGRLDGPRREGAP